VNAGDLVLEVRVADDQPLEAEGVGLAIQRRAGALRDALEELVDVALGLLELAGRQRLENGRARAGGLERALRVERDGGGGDRKEPLGRGLLQLLAAEDDVAEPAQLSVASSAGRAAGCSPIVAPGAGSASPAGISFCCSPEPTSALSFASSSSTCPDEEI
jgi:hypothetical protein